MIASDNFKCNKCKHSRIIGLHGDTAGSSQESGMEWFSCELWDETTAPIIGSITRTRIGRKVMVDSLLCPKFITRHSLTDVEGDNKVAP